MKPSRSDPAPAALADPANRFARRRGLQAALGLLCLAAGSLPASPAHAAAARLESFGPDTWSDLAQSLPRPSIVVFSATWCVNCPAVIDAMAASVRAQAGKAQLAVVVMDGAGQPRLRQAAHYRLADRLFAFEGDDMALRYTVQPRWRGVTPYVVLLGRDAAPPVFVSGRPDARQLAAWAGR